MLRWYLIHTKPVSEGLALRNLQRQGYHVYLPQLVQTVRRSGRRLERISPLFPRYLFLQLNEGQQSLRPATSTVGVSSIVRFGSHHAVVPDEVVDDLRAKADAESGLHRLSHESRLAAGALVKIHHGPFDGLEGIFQREAGVDRVIILLSLLGQNAPVCVPAESVVLTRAL